MVRKSLPYLGIGRMALADPNQIEDVVISSDRQIGLKSVVGATQRRIHKTIQEAIRKSEEKETEENALKDAMKKLSEIDDSGNNDI